MWSVLGRCSECKRPPVTDANPFVPLSHHQAVALSFFFHIVFFHLQQAPSDQFSVRPCFPPLNESFMSLAMWGFFGVEDWNINTAVAPRAPLCRSDTKGFQTTEQIGRVPAPTVVPLHLARFVFLTRLWYQRRPAAPAAHSDTCTRNRKSFKRLSEKKS